MRFEFKIKHPKCLSISQGPGTAPYTSTYRAITPLIKDIVTDINRVDITSKKFPVGWPWAPKLSNISLGPAMDADQTQYDLHCPLLDQHMGKTVYHTKIILKYQYVYVGTRLAYVFVIQIGIFHKAEWFLVHSLLFPLAIGWSTHHY